jgi:hypothetical protein
MRSQQISGRRQAWMLRAMQTGMVGYNRPPLSAAVPSLNIFLGTSLLPLSFVLPMPVRSRCCAAVFLSSKVLYRRQAELQVSSACSFFQ